MENTPDKTDLIALLRNADEQVIRQRLDEIDAEAAALKTLLRAIRARQRVSAHAIGTEERP